MQKGRVTQLQQYMIKCNSSGTEVFFSFQINTCYLPPKSCFAFVGKTQHLQLILKINIFNMGVVTNELHVSVLSQGVIFYPLLYGFAF